MHMHVKTVVTQLEKQFTCDSAGGHACVPRDCGLHLAEATTSIWRGNRTIAEATWGALLMTLVYRKVSGLRPVERHMSATRSAACTSCAAAHTDTAMVNVRASVAPRGISDRKRSAASTAPRRWADRKKCLCRSLRAGSTLRHCNLLPAGIHKMQCGAPCHHASDCIPSHGGSAAQGPQPWRKAATGCTAAQQAAPGQHILTVRSHQRLCHNECVCQRALIGQVAERCQQGQRVCRRSI